MHPIGTQGANMTAWDAEVSVGASTYLQEPPYVGKDFEKRSVHGHDTHIPFPGTNASLALPADAVCV